MIVDMRFAPGCRFKFFNLINYEVDDNEFTPEIRESSLEDQSDMTDYLKPTRSGLFKFFKCLNYK